MELNYDWKSFQSIFYSKKRSARVPETSSAPVYLVLDGSVIVAALSEGEDLSDWIGATSDEVKAEFSHREFVLFNREQVDQWMTSASELPHYYDQIQYYRNEAKSLLIPKLRLKNQDSLVHKHFLLQAIQSWWQKVLPSTFGIYLRLDDDPSHSLFMVIQRGRVDSFQVPDLSSMMNEKRRQPAEIVRYLSERYLIPVQGLFLTSTEWVEWSESPNPWPKIAKALKTNKNKLTPFKWSMASMIACRGYFGF